MSNYLIGFEGECMKCKERDRAYYFFADKSNRDSMLKGTFMLRPANCRRCVTSKIFQVAKTMKWLRKLSGKEVAEDLTKLNGGVQIDFALAEQTAKDNARNDEWLLNNEARIAEVQAWKAKGRTARVR